MADIEQLVGSESPLEVGQKINEIIKKTGAGLQLFDTILKDHVLTYEESKGLALQGTYVYKNAVAGSRYGYPDFYNKVVEEYNASTVIPTWLKNNVTSTGGTFTDNYIFNGASGAYLQLPETAPLNTADSWEFKTKYTYNGGGTYPCILGTSDSTHYHNLHIIVNGGTLKVYLSSNGTSWDIANGLATTFTPVAGTTYYLKIGFTGSNYYVEYNIDGSDTYTNCFELSSTAKVYSSNPLMLMNEGNNLTTYHNLGSMDLSQTSLTIDGDVWWKGADFYNIYKNDNGHVFYNISDKDKIDDIFALTGTAWFYGVDEVNQRVYLPRDNYFAIEGVAPTIGTGRALGVTNDGTTVFPLRAVQNTNGSWDTMPNLNVFTGDGVTASSTLPELNGRSGVKAGGTSWDNMPNGYYGVSTDPLSSGIETHLQPKEGKYLYICVGNTTSHEGMTEVVNQGMGILEQVNQGLETRVKLDGSNAEFPYIVETYVNGTSGYNVYSNGYCEQWGRATTGTSYVGTYLKPFVDTNYNFIAVDHETTATDTAGVGEAVMVSDLTTTGFRLDQASTRTCHWRACGYIA